MKLNDMVQIMKFDARLVERNMKNQVISEQDLRSYLDSLPDLSDKKEQLNLDDNDMDNEDMI